MNKGAYTYDYPRPALPEFYKNDLELHDVILAIAGDLWEGNRR